MNPRRFTLSLAALLLAGCSAGPGADPSAPAAPPAPAAARRFEGLGPYHRPISTIRPEAQRFFDQGMVWMYAFNHDEAIRSFRQAARLDPSAPMPWWGVAVCNGPHINRPGMEPAQNEAAWDALVRARSLRDSATPVEQALIDALASRYAEHPPADRRSLDEAYAHAMADVARRFPDDVDVLVLTAESRMDLRPWDLWTIDGLPHPGTPEIVDGLEAARRLDPHHPGANHLLIHALEASSNPGRANPAAERLRTLVPASGHMVHMPSHIDVRTGRWAMAAESNEAALKADARYRRLSPEQGFYRLYMAHNHHFLAFVSMMEGRRERALRAAREMIAGIPADFAAANAPLVDPYLGIELEVLKRFGRWDDILRAPEPAPSFPVTRAFWSFTRGVALAAKGQVVEAGIERSRFRSLVGLVPADATLSINKAHSMLAIADLVLEAEIAYRQGQHDSAIGALRSAAALEDRLIYMEPPEWMLPVRHTLGAILLDAGRPAEAEAAYREDLRRWPENGWSLFGLARSLRAQSRDPEAAAVEARFDAAWKRADTTIAASCACVRTPAK